MLPGGLCSWWAACALLWLSSSPSRCGKHGDGHGCRLGKAPES